MWHVSRRVKEWLEQIIGRMKKIFKKIESLCRKNAIKNWDHWKIKKPILFYSIENLFSWVWFSRDGRAWDEKQNWEILKPLWG